MKYIEGCGRTAITMLPDCVEDYVGEDNPVRVIDAFVDNLNIESMGFERSNPNQTGRPAYDPRDLLKLYIYGYFNKIRSSRKLMKECSRNVELFFLIGKLRPDFRTIADFRKDNTVALQNVFRAFVKLCMKLKLYQKELIAIDGSKIRAQNSKDNCYTAEVLEKKISTIEKHIAEYLQQLDETDETEDIVPEATADEIKTAIKELSNRKEKYREYLSRVKESGEKQLLTTDPEARRMHSKDGFHCCYNVQTAVDDGSHLIAEYEVTNHNNDTGLLCEVAGKVKKTLECETISTVADKGYDSRKDILDCVMNGVVPTVALKYDKDECLFSLDYEENHINEETRNSTNPVDIQKCLHAGVLPACYENTGISIETQSLSETSCFILNDHGTVTCPTGNILTKVKQRGKCLVFASKEACRKCPNKCTSSSSFKTVSFGPETKTVPVRMYGNISCDINKIPEDEWINPYNHTLDRNDHLKEKRVILKVRMDEKTIKKRKCIVEHPFGTVKWTHGAHYVLCRGKEKAAAELGLSFLAYNLTRAINMVGVKKLIEAM